MACSMWLARHTRKLLMIYISILRISMASSDTTSHRGTELITAQLNLNWPVTSNSTTIVVTGSGFTPPTLNSVRFQTS